MSSKIENGARKIEQPGQPNAMFGKFCTKSFTKIIANYDVSKNHLNLTLGKNIQTRPR